MSNNNPTPYNEEEELTYWRHNSTVGVKIEEISGGMRYSARLWPIMARQVWSENGRDGAYRSVAHTETGAPLLEDSASRISVSHTRGMLVVATLPPTPEVDLHHYSARTAMGVDTERADRTVSDAVRQRVFNTEEMKIIAPENSLLGWICKEALYKATLGQGTSWADDYRILRLPDPDKDITGEALVKLPSGEEAFTLYAWRSGAFLIGVALSKRCATYKKGIPLKIKKEPEAL